MRGLRRGIPTCGPFALYKQRAQETNASDTVVIAIDSDENTPLLKTHARQSGGNSSYCCHNYNGNSNGQEPIKMSSMYNDFSSVNAGSSMSSQYYQRTMEFCEFRLVAIAFILLAGFVIATYLLISESQLPKIRFALDLVNHDIWSPVFIPLGKVLNHSKVLNIMVMQTGGKVCDYPETCVGLLKEMQNSNSNAAEEIPYNFLIGGDGQTYEVRGWDHESGFTFIPQQSSLVLGFMGNYTNIAPSEIQMQSGVSLIRESLRRKKLQKSYKIYALRNITISHNGGEALLSRITKWPQFDALLQVL